MKTFKLFITLSLFGMAIFTAFAFKPTGLIQPAYLDGQCKVTASQCPGGNQTCRIDVDEDSNPNAVTIFEYASGSSCGNALGMGN